MSILNMLDVNDYNFGLDDENDTIDKKKIEGIVSQIEKDVNCFGFDPVKLYDDFEKEVYADQDRIKDMDDPSIAVNYAEFALFRLALTWVYFWGTVSDKLHPNHNPNGFYLWVDGRNEIATNRCKFIARMPEFQNLVHTYGQKIDYSKSIYQTEDVYEKFYYYFCYKVNGSMHRTNVQTATGLMVYALTTLKERDDDCMAVYNKLTTEYGDKFYRMPLI